MRNTKPANSEHQKKYCKGCFFLLVNVTQFLRKKNPYVRSKNVKILKLRKIIEVNFIMKITNFTIQTNLYIFQK